VNDQPRTLALLSSGQPGATFQDSIVRWVPQDRSHPDHLQYYMSIAAKQSHFLYLIEQTTPRSISLMTNYETAHDNICDLQVQQKRSFDPTGISPPPCIATHIKPAELVQCCA
jgi:hypothetical protein